MNMMHIFRRGSGEREFEKFEIPIELIQPHIEDMMAAWNAGKGRLYGKRFAADIVVAFRSKILIGIDQVLSFFSKNEELERARIEFKVIDHCSGFTKIRSHMVPVIKIALSWKLTYHRNTGVLSWVYRKRGDVVRGFCLQEWQIQQSTNTPELLCILSI